MKMKKFVAVLLVLLMVAAMVPIVSANEAAVPGETVSGSIATKDKCYGANGYITVDGKATLRDLSSDNGDTKLTGGKSGSVFLYGTKEVEQVVNFTLAVDADAQAGDVITVYFNYEQSDAMGNLTVSSNSVSFVVEEKGTEPSTPDEPTEPEEPEEPDYPVTPEEPSETVDYSELKKQIGIAESLVQGDYTAESWAKLAYALAAAKNALYSDDQDVVDAAAKALADAIAALVKMDYSKLEAAMASGEELAASDKLGNLWFQLFQAIQEGIKLIGSGDQAAVDACTAKILDLIEQLKAALAEANAEPEEIIKEVIVEKEPEGDYCNISMHRVWPILFFVSLAVNVVFVVLVVVYVVRRKKNAKDDTPLVNYDIGDDA